MTTNTAKPIRLFSRDAEVPASGEAERVSMLVWGLSSCGKTVLAATLPGPILWLGFDPDGEKTIAGDENIHFFNLATLSPDQAPSFMEGEAFENQIHTVLKDHPEIQSVVVDSLTSFSQLALTHAITSGKASGRGFKATMDVPGMSGYGIRNRIVLSTVRMLLRVTARVNRHVCFICHEDTPEKETDDNNRQRVVRVTLLLGGTLPSEVPLQISEIWYMRELNGRREIFLRPFGVIVPMRTRMFRTDKKSSFVWDYNMYDKTGRTVAQMIEQWRAGGPGFKLPVP